MKDVLIVCLALAGMLSSTSSALCQVPKTLSPDGQRQSDLLTTAPLGMPPAASSGQQNSALDAAQLNTLAKSINTASGQGSVSSGSVGSLIPKDLFHTSSKLLSDTHPLEVFQPPASNPSFGVNLGGF
jgi:hypothetical protein